MSSRPWHPTASLRGRLVWSTAALTAVAMAVMVGGLVLVLTHLTTSRVDASLRQRLDNASANLTRQADGSIKLAARQANDVDDSVWVFDMNKVLVSGPAMGSAVRAEVFRLAGVDQQTRTDKNDRIFLAKPVRIKGESAIAGVLVAAESLEPYDSTRNTAIIGLLALGLVMTAGTAGLTGWAVGRTLRPVKRMTELAAEWSEHDLETRFELQGGTDEFSNLGNTLDVLLDRVATAIRNEQQLTAELAHELRTPLTTIRAEAELGLMYSDDLELNERLARVVTQVDRLHATITTLLVAARNMHGTHHRSDVYKVIRDLIAASPDHLPVELDARPGQVFVAASPELVDRIIGPVLDNALRHGREHIKVTARIDRSSVVVEVSDDGPGIEVGDQEAIFTAGIRADTSDGAGLGLALARRVAATARGSVTVTSLSSPTTFEIRLPAR